MNIRHYTIREAETFIEAAATHHSCHLPLYTVEQTTQFVHCDPRGVYWYSLPDLSSAVLQVAVPAIPEPSTLLLMAAGLLVLLWRR